jgi:hypothetical protein
LLDLNWYPESKYELDSGKILLFLKSQIIKSIEEEIERLESKKRMIHGEEKSKNWLGQKEGYNEAIDDQISHFQQQIKLIKEF